MYSEIQMPVYSDIILLIWQIINTASTTTTTTSIFVTFNKRQYII